MDEQELREREAAILKARENISEETLKEYKDIFSFFDRFAFSILIFYCKKEVVLHVCVGICSSHLKAIKLVVWKTRKNKSFKFLTNIFRNSVLETEEEPSPQWSLVR